MSELSGVELGPLFNEEDRKIIDEERAKVAKHDPSLEISDFRLLEMHRIAQRAAQIGSTSPIESEGN